jgi:hypothetical protein
LPQGLGKEPVVADGAPETADGRVDDREQRLVVAGHVMRAGVDLERDPRVDLAVLGEDAGRPDQARRVEEDTRPARIGFDHRPALDVDVVLARLVRQAIGVLVGNRHRELPGQFGHGGEDRRGVGELGEDDQAHRQERGAAADRGVDHRQHPVGVGAHLRPLDRIGEVGLAGGRGVADDPAAHRPLPETSSTASSIGGSVRPTARVFHVSR